jgi:Icc-related predicted phosphoesterase
LALLFGALGDVHGDFDAVRRIMSRHAGLPFWVCVGDVADAAGRYEAFPSPLYWIKGNNENFDAIAEGRLPANLHYMPSAHPFEIQGLRCAGLGGTFAPTWYAHRAAELPHPRKRTPRATELADKRRHFVSEEVEACKRLSGIDLFLTHEAPRPFRVGRLEAGKPQINEILDAMRPRLHLFGHHHRFEEISRSGGPSVGLDIVSRSYLLVDGATLAYERRPL